MAPVCSPASFAPTRAAPMTINFRSRSMLSRRLTETPWCSSPPGPIQPGVPTGLRISGSPARRRLCLPPPSVTDADGRVNTLSYTNTNPTLITGVTDPFGHFAGLRYDSSGRLTKLPTLANLASSCRMTARTGLPTSLLRTAPPRFSTWTMALSPPTAMDLIISVSSARSASLIQPAARTSICCVRTRYSATSPIRSQLPIRGRVPSRRQRQLWRVFRPIP